MKNKDLNTYINIKLEEGNGLPYKEEYWGGMNELLDANMPVQSTVTNTTTAVAKATTGGLKLLYLSSICVSVFAVSYAYTHLFTPSSSEKNKPAIIEEPTTPNTLKTSPTKQWNSNLKWESPMHEETTPGAEHTLPSNMNEETTEAFSIKNPATASLQTSHSNSIDATTSLPDETVNNIPGNIPSIESSATPVFPSEPLSAEENVAYRTVDFIYITPPEHLTSLNATISANTKNIQLIAYPKRDRFIQQINLSPFVAAIHEYDKQTFDGQHADYSHPVQSHFSYGVNAEFITKRLAIRTGIGWSQTSMLSQIETSQDIYKTDTTFVVVNPNYQTTPSGKPVVLIQRRIDSSLSSTKQSTFKESTTYQYLTVPLTLQYRIAYKRFVVVIEGGALHHFLISQQSNTHIEEVNAENRFPVQGYNLQLTAGSGLRYALSSKWALGIHYNYNLNPSSANLHFVNNAHVATVMLTRTIR